MFSASIANKFHKKLKKKQKNKKKTLLKVFQCMGQILKRHGMRDPSIPSTLI
jgi:hypothetical protein